MNLYKLKYQMTQRNVYKMLSLTKIENAVKFDLMQSFETYCVGLLK